MAHPEISHSYIFLISPNLIKWKKIFFRTRVGEGGTSVAPWISQTNALHEFYIFSFDLLRNVWWYLSYYITVAMCGGLCNWNYFHYLYSQPTCHMHTSEWGDYLKEIIFINVPVFHIFPCRHTSVTYRALTVRRFSMETASGCSSRQCPARLRTSSRRTTRWRWRTRWRGTRSSRRSTTPSRSTRSPSPTSTTSPPT